MIDIEAVTNQAREHLGGDVEARIASMEPGAREVALQFVRSLWFAAKEHYEGAE